MSSVRMCDKCGDIFSELEEGWTTSSQTMITRDDDDRPRNVTMLIDLCPDCSPNTRQSVKNLREHRKARKLLELEVSAGIRGKDTIQEELDKLK